MEQIKIHGVSLAELTGSVLSIIKDDMSYSTLVVELNKIIEAKNNTTVMRKDFKNIKKHCERIRTLYLNFMKSSSNMIDTKKVNSHLQALFDISPRAFVMIIVLGSARFNLRTSLENLEESLQKGETSEGEYLKMANQYKMIYNLRVATGNEELNSLV